MTKREFVTMYLLLRRSIVLNDSPFTESIETVINEAIETWDTLLNDRRLD